MKVKNVMIFISGALFILPISVFATEYIRLVDSNPMPPPATPLDSKSASRLTSVVEIFSNAGPEFNSSKIYREFNKNLNASLQEGMEDARRLGQKGVLIQTQIYGTTTDAGTYYSLRGRGAYLIGVGNDPNSVCFSSRCYSILQEPQTPTAQPTDESGYIWVEKNDSGNGYKTFFYNTESIEGRARSLYLNEKIRGAYRAAIVGSAINGYAKQLANVVNTIKERNEILGILKNKDEAEKRYKEIDAQLAKDLKRAESAAKTSSTLNAIAGILSLASTISLASVSMGEDISNSTVSGALSKEDVLNTVNAIEMQTGQKIKSLKLEQNIINDSINGYEAQILKIGIEYLPPPSGSVLAPLP